MAIESFLGPNKTATVVVHPTPGVGDTTTIQDALNMLPAAGGTVFIREGTYTISSTLTLPDKPIEITGCGDASVIDMTSSVIAAFTIGYNQVLAFSDIKIKGNGSSGQIAFSIANAVNAAIPMVFSRVSVSNIEKVFVAGASSYAGVTYTDSSVTFAALATSLLWSGGSGAVVLHNVTATNDGAAYKGGIAGDPYIWASDCNLAFIAASSMSAMWASSSAFIGSFTITSVRSLIVGCNHSAYSVTRRIDLAAGATNTIIKGCKFNDWTNEAVRVAASNCIIEGNENCKITETGTPTGNLYSNNLGISGSTLLGTNCRIGTENYRNVMDFGAKGDGSTNDQAAIQAAINALPAAGGVVYFPPGNYRITSTVTLPNKDVMVIGAGKTSTTISLGNNVISAITAPYNKRCTFEHFTILGNYVDGQIGIDYSGPTNNMDSLYASDLRLEGLDIGFQNSGAGLVYWTMVHVSVFLRGATDSYFTSGSADISCYRVDSQSGGFINATLRLNRCNFTGITGGTFSSVSQADECTFGVMAVRAPLYSSYNGCRFGTGASILIPSGNGRCKIVGCGFEDATIARHIDIETGANGVTVAGCHFVAATSENLRNEGQNGAFVGNTIFKVTEVGSADYNRYAGNVGFTGSTLLGANDVVETEISKSVSAGNTTDAFVEVFEHKSFKGIVGIGTIKNTGANSLDVKETVTDAFGTAANVTTTVNAGNDYLLDPQTNISTARPPYVSYKVEVKSTAAGNATTYDLRHVTHGAL